MKSIILAGGVGTRLWPLSREYYPKQFIQLGGRSLFQKTCERAVQLSGQDSVYVVTHDMHQFLARSQLKEIGCPLPDDHLLVEPVGKNTLPAIAWAMQKIRAIDPSSPVVVFPSDHMLGIEALDQIRSAEHLAKEYLVTFGVRPDSPHTGYGYISPGSTLPPGNIVREFKEKPNVATAQEYLRNGYLWNSGIFLISAGVFFEELARYSPGIAAAFSGREDPDYPSLESISIDYGLLEHSQRVAVVPLEAAWSDLGTFKALYDAEPHDAEGNTGEADYIRAKDNFVHAPNRHVGLIGVRNLVVVDTDDALLVCDKDQTEQVRELVALYNRRGDPVTKYHRQVFRPWGSYTVLENSTFFKIKRVTVQAGKKLSLQLHHHRSEHWVVVSGAAEVELDGKTQILRQGESTFVRNGMQHRLSNPGVIPLEVIEVQLGEYLEEDDIVRFADDFGRQ